MKGIANSETRKDSRFWILTLLVLEFCLVYRNRRRVRILKNKVLVPVKQYWLVCFAALCFWILQHSTRESQHTFQRSCSLFAAFPYSPSLNKLPFADTLCFNANVHEVLSSLCKKDSEIKQLTFENATPRILQYVHTMASPLSQKTKQKMHFCFSCFIQILTWDLN